MPDIKINLNELFSVIESKNYCVIKLPQNFPDYSLGSDLDLFCYDIEEMSREILAFLQCYINYDIDIKIINMSGQIYIDLIENNEIHFRFDLYGEMPHYKNLLIKSSLFSSIIENSRLIVFNGCSVKVPCSLDEAVLRYIEYQEWYSQRPDKIKHIEYIEMKSSEGGVKLDALFSKLHYYTELPSVRDVHRVSKAGFLNNFDFVVGRIKRLYKMIKQKGVKETYIIVKRKLKK